MIHSTRDPLRVAVAQLGARRHYAVPEALRAAGLLDSFVTDLYAASPWLGRAARWLDSSRLLDRVSPGIPRAKVRHFPWFGFRRAWRSRRTRSASERLQAYLEANRAFGILVCGHWPAGANAFYAFNSAGLEIFEEAKRRGHRCFLDQITAPWAIEEPLVEEERLRWPGWEPAGVERSAWEPLAIREQKEWALANAIICGSEFVRNGIVRLGGPAQKCVVVPYGVNDSAVRSSPRERHTGPLRVLFAGSLQLRKGIQYLDGAARALSPDTAVFRAVGASQISSRAMQELAVRMDLRGAVRRSAMQDEYEWADLLVVPSISEGSANVAYEALAAGLPVIATAHAGTVVRDDVEGYIVGVRDPQAIAQRIEALASDRDLWSRLSAGATARSREFTWSTYAERLANAISEGTRT